MRQSVKRQSAVGSRQSNAEWKPLILELLPLRLRLNPIADCRRPTAGFSHVA